MSKRDELAVARALLAKAAGDEAGLRALADRDDVPDHVAGFLAQQALEKSLKAVELRAVAQEIAETTGGPYTEGELSEAREWLPSSSTPAG